jgi:putative DNA primase/helicase
MENVANTLSCVNDHNLPPELDFYARNGAALFPIPAGQKDPRGIVGSFLSDCSRDPERWKHWRAERPSCNFGVVACASNWIIVDTDANKAGRDAAWAARKELLYASWGLAPFVPHCQSGRGGFHDYFSVPEGVDARALRQPDAIKGLINLRCRGFTVAAGSYYDGRAKGEDSGWYELLPGAPPGPVPAPAALLALCTRAAATSTTTAAPTGMWDTGDVAGLVRWLTDRGHFAVYEDWLGIGMALKLECGDEGLPIWQLTYDGTVTAEVERIKWDSFASEPVPGAQTLNTFMDMAHKAGWKGTIRKSSAAMFSGVAAMNDNAPSIVPAAEPFTPLFSHQAPGWSSLPAPGGLPPGTPLPVGNSLTGPRGDILPSDCDESLALSFASAHADDIRYVAETSRWLCWDGTRWRTDKTSMAYYAVRQHIREFAFTIHLADARKVASARTVAAVERMSRTDPRIATEAAMWDCDPWLLNTPGGVVDLHTGLLRPACPSDHMTKITSVAPGGECPLWLAFLNRSLGGDTELIAYLQRALGYALTGITREHALFFHHGAGGNGKGVFLNTVAKIIGDYGTTAPVETFLASQFERHPTDLAGMAGKRLVVANEVPQGRYWDEPKIKTLTGGDKISARFMRQDFFEFTPQFKLFVVGNHKPSLRSVDTAIRRRLHLTPWNVEIPKGECDVSLPQKLENEWGGILAWMIEGCLAWGRCGLQPPRAVLDATDTYLSGEDALSAWIEECCDLAPEAFGPRDRLFDSWLQWSKKSGGSAGTRNDFYDALRRSAHGCDEHKKGGIRGFKGVCTKPWNPAALVGGRPEA